MADEQNDEGGGESAETVKLKLKTPDKPKGGLNIGSILVAMVVLGFFAENIALFGFYQPWKAGMPDPAWSVHEAEKVASKEPSGPASVLKLDSFLVNLADSGDHRYVKATLQLGLDSAPEATTALATNEAALAPTRQLVIDALSRRIADEIVKPEGKAALRSELIEGINALKLPARVIDIYITELLVQF